MVSGQGTITNLGAAGGISGAVAMSFGGFGSYVIDSGSSWTLNGTHTLAVNQTLADFGTIKGGPNLGSASDRLIVGKGALISGAVAGGGGTLEMASGTGTITGLGATGTISGGVAMSFSGFGSYLIDAGSAWTFTGTNTRAAGQSLVVGGALTNLGTLSGLVGVYAGTTGAATVTNFGSITGTGGVALQFKSASDRLIVEGGSACIGSVQGGGGTLELASGTGAITGLGASGTISGASAMTFSGFGSYLIDAASAWTFTGINTRAAGQSLVVAGSLTNLGTITAAAGAGVSLTAGASVVNGNSATPNATISGVIGVYVGPTGAATITNYGSIQGTGGVALQFTSARDLLIVEGGSKFLGAVQGGGGTLELASGTGTITGLGATTTISGGVAMTCSGFGLTLFEGGSWTLAGTNTGFKGGVALMASPALLALSGTMTNQGTLVGGAGYAQSGGGLGAAGAYLYNVASLANAGMIQGGSGQIGAYNRYGGGIGGRGGDGVDLTAHATVTNLANGVITGAAGGKGGGGYYVGGAGGVGGAGVGLAAGGSVSNAGLIAGGQGGAYGDELAFYLSDFPQGGPGGVGGAGAILNGGGSLSNTGVITGGRGGAGTFEKG